MVTEFSFNFMCVGFIFGVIRAKHFLVSNGSSKFCKTYRPIDL